jgi:hypothetical protein
VGAAVNVFDQIGRTPLMEVRTAHIEELLVANGAIDIFDAVKAGNVPFVSEFLAKLASRNAAHLSLPFLQHRTNKDGDTLLPLAIACGQHGFAKSLIGVHADVNHRNRLGDTALMMAVSNRDSDAVKLLLSAGAKVNVANVKGQTPLRLARDVDDKVLCELLAEKCVHIWGAGETKDQESNACLHVSVCSDCGTAKREYVHDYSIVSHKSERGRDWQSSDTDYVCKKCGKTDHKHTWEYTDW